MPWVWTDELAAAVGDDEQVDRSLIRAWTSTPMAVHAADDESPTLIAERLGALLPRPAEPTTDAR